MEKLIAKKSLGQNFLRSEKALGQIVDASRLSLDDVVLEIGPGEGVLTEKLLQFSGKVIAVEKDHRLIPILKEKFRNEIDRGKFELVEKDILEFDPEILSTQKHPYKVIANIPYYITGQIFRMFLEAESEPELMTILVQKEVAERIVAKDKKESLLSISVKIYGEPKIIAKVPRGAFVPAPNVDSAILLIENISKNKLSGVDQEQFWKIVHAGFAHKRKQLLPNLSSIFEREKILNSFEKISLNPKIRAENLSPETWIKLCTILAS